MISRDEVLMGREVQYPLSQALEDNLKALLIAVNEFRAVYGKPMIVSSGYRPGDFNKKAGGAPNSAHALCLAVDFKDADGALDAWCLAHLDVLERCGLYLEDPASTKFWTHLTIRAPHSGARVFKP